MSALTKPGETELLAAETSLVSALPQALEFVEPLHSLEPVQHKDQINQKEQITATAQLPQKASKRRLKRGINSVFTASLAAFLGLNLFFSYSQPIAFDMYRYIYRGWAWWTFHDLREHPEAHNVAILGSSLTVSATNGCDANFLNKNLDLTEYHGAMYLDQELQSKFGGKFNTYNLSAPGQMPSDAYFTLRSMVATAERPDVVVYGLAPRDFIDSTLSSPVDTEPFRYLTRLVSPENVSKKLFRNPFSKLDAWLQRVCYGYGNCLNYQMAVNDLLTAFVDKVVPCPHSAHPFTYWDRIKLLPKYLAGEIKPGAMICPPMSEETAHTNFKDNTQEYKERYHRPDPYIYKTQFYFLKELANFCRREKIELVLVNMPLTRYNVSLLKPFWYLNFSQALREFAFYNNVVEFDLNDFNRYAMTDYHDSVHLNAFGGKKLFDSLVQEASRNRRTRAALELAGKELEREQQVAASGKQPEVQ